MQSTLGTWGLQVQGSPGRMAKAAGGSHWPQGTVRQRSVWWPGCVAERRPGALPLSSDLRGALRLAPGMLEGALGARSRPEVRLCRTWLTLLPHLGAPPVGSEKLAPSPTSQDGQGTIPQRGQARSSRREVSPGLQGAEAFACVVSRGRWPAARPPLPRVGEDPGRHLPCAFFGGGGGGDLRLPRFRCGIHCEAAGPGELEAWWRHSPPPLSVWLLLLPAPAPPVALWRKTACCLFAWP